MATQFLLDNQITATKYYETTEPINSSTGNNETDICLSLVNGIKPVLNNETFVGGELLSQPGKNLKFTDPNGSINSQTFAIASVNNSNSTLQNNAIVNLLLGKDKFNDNVETFISEDASTSTFVNNYLKIETTKNLGPFDSTDSLYQASFEESKDDLLSMAVNTAHNQIDEYGLLKIAEDATYNNSYALGKNTAKYFTQDAITKQLVAHDILSSNSVDTNKVGIQTIPNNTPFDDSNFGTFKISVENPQITITKSEDPSLMPLGIFDQTIDVLPSSLTVEKYEEMFGDDSYNSDSLQVEITTVQNPGFHFVNALNNDHVTLNNDAIVDNVNYVKNVASLSHSLEVTQQPMSIVLLNGSQDNSNHFSLSSDGEYLTSPDFNTDGEIKMDFNSPTQRANVENKSVSFKDINVDYNSLANELKTTKDVSYELKKHLLPTGNGQYSSDADSNGASLYSDLNPYTEVNLNSSIDVDNSVKLIKVDPVFEIDSATMYKLVDNELDTLISNVDISAAVTNFTGLSLDSEYRIKLVSKKLTDLDIRPELNNLVIQDTMVESNDNSKWNLYFDPEYNNQYLMSALDTTSNPSNFPSVDKSISMLASDASANVSLTYTSVTSSNNTSTLFDCVNILCDGVTTQISKQSLTFYNESSAINHYKLLDGLVTDKNNVSYKVVEYSMTQTYQSKFMFPLSVFGNILMSTPLLRSKIRTYVFFSSDTDITISTTNPETPNDTMVVSKKRILTVSVPLEITENFNSIEEITLAGNQNNEAVVLNFAINKKSLTPLNAVFQIKSESSWENITDLYTDIDAYYSTTQLITDVNGHSASLAIIPTTSTNTSSTLQLIDAEYAIPLGIDLYNLSLTVKGYNYPVEDFDLDVLSDPNNFINSLLPANGQDLNLSVNYTSSLLQSNSYLITINVCDVNNVVISTITLDTSVYFGSLVIAKNVAPLFYMQKNVEESDVSVLLFGDESVSQGSSSGISSGKLDMTDGVQINYENLGSTESLKFSLLCDKISVSNVGSAGTPSYIDKLEYTSANSKTVTIDYYRGYLNDNARQTYKISRKDLVSAKVKATDAYVFNMSSVYVNHEEVISFNDTISIGITAKTLFSRLPDSLVQNNKYTMNMEVVADNVKITRTVNNVDTVTNKKLTDYLLYTFESNLILVSKGITSANNVDYKIQYFTNSAKVYFANNYKTNPSDISWSNTPILSLSVNELKSGKNITNVGQDVNGYIKLTVTAQSEFDTVSYFVYAPPYLYATQATKNASATFPFNISNNASELKTVYFPNTDYNSANYTPFKNVSKTNNVSFTTAYVKPFADYNDSSKNMGVQTINITGSNIKLTELKSNNPETPSSNGVNRDGVLYNGRVVDLVNFSSNYLNFVSKDQGVINVSYTQDLGGLFELLFGDNADMHKGNIVLNIGNSILPTANNTMQLQITNGSIVNVYDVYQVNKNNTLELYLLKYVYDMIINYENVPKDIYIKRLPGSVSDFYYSKIVLPLVNLGETVNDVLTRLTKSNMSLDVHGNIVWTKKTSFDNNLSLQITPLTSAGVLDMVTLFYTDREVLVNYTIVNIPNAYEVLNADGTFQTVITGLGKIKTQTLNSSKSPLNTDIDFSMPNNQASLLALNNSDLYNVDIQLDTQP
jgi:hypothetical protein